MGDKERERGRKRGIERESVCVWERERTREERRRLWLFGLWSSISSSLSTPPLRLPSSQSNEAQGSVWRQNLIISTTDESDEVKMAQLWLMQAFYLPKKPVPWKICTGKCSFLLFCGPWNMNTNLSGKDFSPQIVLKYELSRISKP